MKHRNHWLAEFIANKNIPTELVEYILAHLNLKIVEEMREGKFDLADAEDLLYNFKVCSKLDRRKVSRACREIIEWGMQLEDWKDYTPSKLNQVYDRLEEFSKKILKKKFVSPHRGVRRRQAVSIA